MFTKLLSVVSLAATFVLPQAAPAGSCGCSCGGFRGGYSVPPAVPVQPAGVATPRHEGAAPAPGNTVQPPTASGEGRVIRRFSYEPGADAVPRAVVAPAYRPAAPASQPAAPAYRSSQATRMGQSVGGLTGEARLHPGRGR